MSIFGKTEDTNYWPSISDMFLVLFVIALAMYCASQIKDQQGDAYVQDEVVAQTNILLGRFGLPEYNPREEGDEVGKPVLAGKLMEIYGQCNCRLPGSEEELEKNSSVLRAINELCLREVAYDSLHDLKEKAQRNYRQAVVLLAWRCLYVPECRYEGWNRIMQQVEGDDMEDWTRMNQALGALKDHDVLRYVNATLAGKGIGKREATVAELEKKLSDAAAKRKALEEDLKKAEEAKKKAEEEKKRAEEAKKKAEDAMKKAEDAMKKAEAGEKSWHEKYDAEHQKTVAKDARVLHVMLDESKVKFRSGVTDFENAETANRELAGTAEKIKEFIDMGQKNKAAQKYIIEIIGHTDTDGSNMKRGDRGEIAHALETDAANPQLGLQRAEKVKNYLEYSGKLGLALDNVEFKCYSASWTAPLSPGKYGVTGVDSTEVKSRNRRVEVSIRPKDEKSPAK